MEFNLHRKDGQTTDEIYENDDVIKGKIGKEITDSTQGKSSEFTESVCVRIRSSRAAAVCLVLLCVLLLTAVIVLCVMFTQERQQFISKIENLTNERVQLISKNENLTNERVQLISKNENLTNDRVQLISKNEKLTNERVQLISKNEKLTNERVQLISKNEKLTNERDQLRNYLKICAECTCYQSSCYFISKEKKSWTESRRYCTERGADLIIINNREEQDFVKNISNSDLVWIGLTDSDVEGRWKWVDGSTLTSGFWAPTEPNGNVVEDCALTYSPGWADYPCNDGYRWICEKTIFK